ncbi:MAG: peptidase MA family metallohydrolase [Phycisphaerales bacterium]
MGINLMFSGVGEWFRDALVRAVRVRRARIAGRCSKALAIALASGTLLALGAPALAQGEEEPRRHGVLAPPRTDSPDLSPPPLAEGVLKALEATYLTDDERADLRVFHGVWNASDLASVSRRARAALLAGVIGDPSLMDPAAASEDRAEAALLRGEPEKSLEMLAGVATARGARVRAEALEMLGRWDEADAAVEPLAAQLRRDTASASDITEGVLAMLVRGRIRGMSGADFGGMMELLGHAQQSVDRLHWPAVLAQARLLWEKDNGVEAQKALRQVLSMNPSCAAAWRMMGETAVSGFAFDGAEAVAGRQKTIGALVRGSEEGGGGWGDGRPAVLSVDAALILARARMRQNAPDLAEEALAPVLEAFPKHREALALRAAVQAVRHDDAGTQERLEAFDRLWAVPVHDDRGPVEAYLAVGRALAEARQYDKAAAFLSKAAARNPKIPDALIELGLLNVQAGKDIEARDALRAAVKMDPFNIRAANSLTLVEELATYVSFESEHFVVRCKPGVDEVVAKEMLGPLEGIHKVVCATFEHTPEQRTIIELMPNHEWFAVRITGMPGIHTIAASTGPIIAMEAPREGRGHFGVYDWERVVRHEFAHTVNLSQTNYRVPLWFTEAAAVSVEFAPYDYSTCQLLVNALTSDTLFNLVEINEAFVRPKKPTDRQQAYMQGNWMYRYIVDTWGASAPVRLMERFALGEREAKAFPAVLGVETDAFMTGFRAWARKDAASWGMLPSPSLDELRLGWMLKENAERNGLSERLTQIGRVASTLLAGHATAERPENLVSVELAPALPELVEGWLREHPEHPDLLEIKLAGALGDAGEALSDDLVAMLRRFAEARPMDPAPHKRLARHFLAAGDEKARSPAIPHLEFLDIREQYSPAYAANLAKLYAAAGDLDAAWKKAERATRISGYDPALRELAATIALRRKQPKDGERHIAALVALEPNQPVHTRRLEAVRKMVGE